MEHIELDFTHKTPNGFEADVICVNRHSYVAVVPFGSYVVVAEGIDCGNALINADIAVDGANGDADKLLDELAECEEQLDDLAEALEVSRDECAEYEDLNQELLDNINDLEDRVAELEDALTDAHDTIESLEMDLDECADAYDDLKSECD